MFDTIEEIKVAPTAFKHPSAGVIHDKFTQHMAQNKVPNGICRAIFPSKRPDQIGMVHNIPLRPVTPRHNGNAVWARSCLEHAESNPYYARHYAMRTVTNNKYESTYFLVEKLDHLHSLSSKHILALAYTAFGEEYVTANFPKRDEVNAFDAKEYKYVILTAFTDMLTEFIGYSKPKHVAADENLEAIKLQLQALLRDPANNVALDIHEENVMVRRTAFGCQLVFTDPLVG